MQTDVASLCQMGHLLPGALSVGDEGWCGYERATQVLSYVYLLCGGGTVGWLLAGQVDRLPFTLHRCGDSTEYVHQCYVCVARNITQMSGPPVLQREVYSRPVVCVQYACVWECLGTV